MSDLRTMFGKHLKYMVSVGDIARATGVGSSAVTNWSTRNEDWPEPVLRFGPTVIYDKREVEAWLRARRKPFDWDL